MRIVLLSVYCVRYVLCLGLLSCVYFCYSCVLFCYVRIAILHN